MIKYNYTLDLSSKKFICPRCGKKTFVRYVDNNGEYINDEDKGRCDREDRCGYFVKPTEKDTPSSTSEYFDRLEKERSRPVIKNYRFGIEDVNSTSKDVMNSMLFKFLSQKVGIEKTTKAFTEYRVGLYPLISNADWSVFWQIGSDGWVRTAKIIRYGIDGRRSKSDAPIWWHNISPKENHKPKQCLFGSHLIGEKPVAVVESEKTALICSIFIDSFTWVATGGKSNKSLTDELKGRDVTMFPDLGAYRDWFDFGHKQGFNVSNYIEGIASDIDRENGYDLADFLLR